MTRLRDAPNRLGRFLETSKRTAAIKQIHAAIWHCRHEQFECAVTLAAAAEGLLPQTEEKHLFQILKNSPLFEKINLNRTINWLKHPGDPEEQLIPEFEVAVVIVRVITKFQAVYEDESTAMRDFIDWTFDQGHLPRPDNSAGPAAGNA